MALATAIDHPEPAGIALYLLPAMRAPSMRSLPSMLYLTLQITLLHSAAVDGEQDRCRTLTSVKAVDDLFGGRVGVRVLALVPDEGKAAAAFRAVAQAFKYPAEFYLVDGPDLVRRAVDQAERLRLYAAAEAKMHDNAVLLLKPYDELVDVTTFTTSKKGRKKLSRWVEDRMLPLVVPFYPDYVDMIFGGPLKMHAILAVDPADPPAPPVRDAFYHAAQRHRGKVMHIAMFKAPDCVEINQ